MGLSAFGLKFDYFRGAFIFWALFGCLIGRYFCIYPLCSGYNMMINHRKRQRSLRRNLAATENTLLMNTSSVSPMIKKMSLSNFLRDQDVLIICPKLMHMLWFAGLRGAVAYACAKNYPDIFGHRKDFVDTTIAIVLFTIFVFGGTTEMALNALDIETNVDDETYRIRTGRIISMFLDFGMLNFSFILTVN